MASLQWPLRVAKCQTFFIWTEECADWSESSLYAHANLYLLQDTGSLTLYSIVTPMKYHEFENIMENGAFALLEQMLHFP